MIPVFFPVPEIKLCKLGVVPVHQHVFPVLLLSRLGVVEAALLHSMAINNNDLIVGDSMLEIDADWNPGVGNERRGRVLG